MKPVAIECIPKNYNFNLEFIQIIDEGENHSDEQQPFTAEARRTQRFRRGVLRFIAINLTHPRPISKKKGVPRCSQHLK